MEFKESREEILSKLGHTKSNFLQLSKRGASITKANAAFVALQNKENAEKKETGRIVSLLARRNSLEH